MLRFDLDSLFLAAHVVSSTCSQLFPHDPEVEGCIILGAFCGILAL